MRNELLEIKLFKEQRFVIKNNYPLPFFSLTESDKTRATRKYVDA